MEKMGKILKREHQMCLSHALHLAVTDVMYKLPKSLGSTDRAATTEDEAEASSGEESESEDEDQEEDEESEPLDDSSGDKQIEDDMVLVTEIDIVIKKIRKICKKIKKSPLKNDSLQFYIRQKHTGNFLLIIENYLKVIL